MLFDELGGIKSISFEIIFLGNQIFSSTFTSLRFETFNVINLSILSSLILSLSQNYYFLVL